MRNLFSILAILFCTSTVVFSQSELSYRLVAKEYSQDDKNTAISIQIKADDASLNLADQYYRFYYDASNMKLNDQNTTTELPTSHYYQADIVEHIEGYDASRVGELEYDSELGFINLYIELTDLTTGGTAISPQDRWVTVATLDFSIENTDKPLIATWARADRTRNYTSAYAIVAEWQGKDLVAVTSENEYNDLYAIASKATTAEDVEITIGPNPTADYIKVRNTQGFNQDATVVLRDLNGSVLKSQDIAGNTEATIELSSYTSGAYLVEVLNGTQSKTITEKIIFTRS